MHNYIDILSHNLNLTSYQANKLKLEYYKLNPEIDKYFNSF